MIKFWANWKSWVKSLNGLVKLYLVFKVLQTFAENGLIEKTFTIDVQHNVSLVFWETSLNPSWRLPFPYAFIKLFLLCVFEYSQTWVNDHLWITTTCLQRPLFRGHNFNFHNVKLLLNNDHLSTTAPNFGSRGWWLYTCLTLLLK